MLAGARGSRAGASTGGPVASASSATTAASASASAPVDAPANVEEAKRYFEEGESLRSAHQYQAALEAYLKSRALSPRASNTLNSGVCLFHLERYDEAYELFEEALTKFPEGALPRDARASAMRSMADIETKVARLEVSANVDGALVIDGRTRGKLPLAASVRVLPGKHVVRVFRDGFQPFETVVELRLGETRSIDAKLAALTSAGRLRIDGDAALEGGAVTIDGATIGSIPWEGVLSPGSHVWTVVKGDLGCAPAAANVIVAQTVSLSATARPLGPERRIVVEPATAELVIDGVVVGRGRFQGRLPVGAYVVEARELGYVAARVSYVVDRASSADLPIVLKIDATHPRWGGARASGRFGVELFGGYGLAGSFGNDTGGAGGWCVGATTGCAQTAAPRGLRVGATGLYELPGGLSASVSAGFLSYARRAKRPYATSFAGESANVNAAYELTDDVSVSGPLAGAGVGYRVALVGPLDLSGRVQVVAAFVGSRDRVAGTASDGTRVLPIYAEGSNSVARGLMLFVTPEVSAGLSFGKLRLALGVALPISLVDGPEVKLGDTQIADVSSRNAAANRNGIDNAPGFGFGAGMRAFGRFVTVVPQVSVGYWF
jgi:hypothetical protein